MDKVIHVYTDGGCRGNHEDNNIGAWGVYMECGELTKTIAGATTNTTNNKMELQGAIEGLKAIKNRDLKVILYLDSAYVLNGLKTWIDKNWKPKGWRTSDKKPVKNVELWKELDELRSKFKDIEYVKVKGHAGVHGNEMADMALNEAMDNLKVSN